MLLKNNNKIFNKYLMIIAKPRVPRKSLKPSLLQFPKGYQERVIN